MGRFIETVKSDISRLLCALHLRHNCPCGNRGGSVGETMGYLIQQAAMQNDTLNSAVYGDSQTMASQNSPPPVPVLIPSRIVPSGIPFNQPMLEKVPAAQSAALLENAGPLTVYDINLSDADLANGRTINVEGYAIYFERKNSLGIAVLDIVLGSEVKSFYPGGLIQGHFQTFTVKRNAKCPSYFGSVRLIVMKRPDANYVENSNDFPIADLLFSKDFINDGVTIPYGSGTYWVDPVTGNFVNTSVNATGVGLGVLDTSKYSMLALFCQYESDASRSNPAQSGSYEFRLQGTIGPNFSDVSAANIMPVDKTLIAGAISSADTYGRAVVSSNAIGNFASHVGAIPNFWRPQIVTAALTGMGPYMHHIRLYGVR